MKSQHPLLLALAGVASVAVALATFVLTISDAPSYRSVDVQANLFTDSEQDRAALGVGPDGRSVVVWQSRRQERGTYGVYARAFDNSGMPLTGETRMNSFLPGSQQRPAVAVAIDGTAWAVWESWGQDGSGAGVVARRFSVDLTPLDGEIPVNVARHGDQSDPVVAVNDRGRGLVAWSSTARVDGGPLASEVRARLFDSDGTPHGGEIVLTDEAGDSRSGAPAVAASDGRFLVVWSRSGVGGGILGRYVDADGKPETTTFRLSPLLPGAPSIEPAVAVDGEGRFAVAWLRPRSTGYAVEVRRFTAGGQPLGDPQVVAESDGRWHSAVALAAAADGRLAVSYNSESSRGDESRIEVRLLTADGGASIDLPQPGLADAIGTRRLSAVTGAQRTAWAPDDRLLFAWNGDAGGDDDSAAHLTLWGPTSTSAPASAEPASKTLRSARQVASEEFLAANPPIWDPDFRPQARLAVAAGSGGDFGFEGIPGTGWTPPDPESAVGPEHIVVMTNGAIAAFDRLGNLQWDDEIENSFGFWGELGTDNFVFDPEVMWDPHSERFFAMANERSDNSRSYFLLAVSKDDRPDDRDDWHKYRIDVTAISGNDIDSPNLSTSRDYVLLTADFFGPDKYLIYVLDKSSILEGGTPVANHELITGFSQQSMGIPVVYSDDATLYIVQSTENVDNDEVIFHAITDPIANYSRQTFTLTVPNYTYPNSPPQKGSSSRPFLFEPRFWSVAERNGSIWAVHHVNSSRARVRWYEFALNGWPAGGSPTMSQMGELDLGDGIHTYFPSIHVDALDNAAITFARSASNEYISMGRAVRGVGDAPNTFRPVQVSKLSFNAHTSGRWGDYSGTQADPVIAGSFWGHHEFTDGAASSWRTWVTQYDIRPEAMVLTVDPLTAGSPATLEVTGATPGATVYFVFSAIGTGLTDLPALETVISLEDPSLLRMAVADGAGIASFTVTVPVAGAGRTVWLQATETGHATNWLQRTIQSP